MQYGEDLDLLPQHAIRHDERRAGDHQFPSAGDAPGTAPVRKLPQPRHGGANPLAICRAAAGRSRAT